MIRHHCIVQMHGFCQAGYNCFLVLELLHTHLRQAISAGRLPWAKCVSALSDAAMGCMVLHSYQVCHRDVRPHNILLTEDCSGKVADFGAACIMGPVPDQVGTLGYVHPNAAGLATPNRVGPAWLDITMQVHHEFLGKSCEELAAMAEPQWPQTVAHEMASLGLRCLAEDRSSFPEILETLGMLG